MRLAVFDHFYFRLFTGSRWSIGGGLTREQIFALGRGNFGTGLSVIPSGNVVVRTGLPPWRRSADRTYLRANSLLTENFTGNFAILKLRDSIWYQETAALQPLPEQFPTQINRENIFADQGTFFR